MACLVGAEGDRRRHSAERFVGSGRQRLFDHGDTEIASGGEHRQYFGRPCLIGIDDEAGIGRVPAHRAHAIQTTGAASLSFKQRPVGLGLAEAAISPAGRG